MIKRRLTDELRREYRIRSEIATSPDTLESGSLDPEADDYSSEVRSAMSRQAIQSYNEQAYSVKDEIEAVQSILKTYGFTFFDLTECSPKTDKTKKECARAVAALLENEELFNEMSRKKALPVKALLEKSGVKSKILERHRKYIIAAAVILNGEYPLLAEYMSYIRKSLKT